ncbi:DNA-binding transcriptional regulator, LysR family [Actinokineospora alba]|uniref:DNA-binding transcriptional regulator, LysR family n=1 Tax=Actinokineospora alba TaxID=504798 RepID=A0A1H0EM78_9PSEU|nr:DNA-binding transcriptional LysR family regulator [Actinokineospora alba]SDI23526.1 DNA-binding transcriptional regulator, LysR family [Actinokineospora alba]SDN83504.1 DNA-binding transcriptional regulator, LysR family [Actinokineospora alba]
MINGPSISNTDLVDPHLLRTFVTVARLGSFSAAAHELGYTQSAVSQQISVLEGDLGAKLFTRRPVAPTTVGLRLLDHAEPLLLRLEAARADLARLSSVAADEVTVAMSPLAAPPSLAAAAHALRGLTVRVVGREEAIASVARGTADVALVDGMAAPSDPLHLTDISPLTTRAVVEQPLAVALPTDHPLAGRSALRLTDLADARWIDAPDAAIPLARLRVSATTDGFRACLRYEGCDVTGLLALVAAGLGLAVLPASAITTAAVPISVPRAVHRIELVHNGTLTGQVARFATAVSATAQASNSRMRTAR